jgi:hypothetical protein
MPTARGAEWDGAKVRRRIRRTVSPLSGMPRRVGHPRTGFAACLAPEQGWWDVRAYEQERDKVIAQQRVIVLCT